MKKKFEIELTDEEIYKLLEIIDNESDLCDGFWYEDQNVVGTYDTCGAISMTLAEYLTSRLKSMC